MVRVVDKPKVIIYRFTDVLITRGRIKDDYIQCTTENIFDFLTQFWGHPDLMRLLDAVRDESYDDRDIISSTPIVFKEIQNPKAILDSVCIYVNWKCRHTGYPKIGNYRQAHNQLIRLVMQYALVQNKGLITIHDRYANAIQQRHKEGIRQTVLSRVTSNLVDHQRQLLAFTTQGDLTQYMDLFFNTTLYPTKDSYSYDQLATILNVEPAEILFFSSNLEECRSAKSAGLNVVKVKLPGEAKNTEFIRIRDMSTIVMRQSYTANVTAAAAAIASSPSQNTLIPSGSSGSKIIQRSRLTEQGMRNVIIPQLTSRNFGGTNNTNTNSGNNSSGKQATTAVPSSSSGHKSTEKSNKNKNNKNIKKGNSSNTINTNSSSRSNNNNNNSIKKENSNSNSSSNSTSNSGNKANGGSPKQRKERKSLRKTTTTNNSAATATTTTTGNSPKTTSTTTAKTVPRDTTSTLLAMAQTASTLSACSRLDQYKSALSVPSVAPSNSVIAASTGKSPGSGGGGSGGSNSNKNTHSASKGGGGGGGGGITNKSKSKSKSKTK